MPLRWARDLIEHARTFDGGQPLSELPTDTLGEVDSIYSSPEEQAVPSWLRSRRRLTRISTSDGMNLAIGASKARQLLTGVPENTDALGFYAPFHFYSDAAFGVYIRSEGIAWLAYELDGANPSNGLAAARQLIEAHEFMHAKVEYIAAQAEVIARSGLYEALFTNQDDHDFEEAFANAAGIQALDRQSRGLRGQATNFMNRQGRGYRDYHQYAGRSGIYSGEKVLVARLASLVQERPAQNVPGFPEGFRNFRRLIPVYLVSNDEEEAVAVFKPFPRYGGLEARVYTNDHAPPHVHFEALDGNWKGRVLWPSLDLYKGDPTPGAKELKKIHAYCEQFRSQLAKKVATVPWTGGPH